MTTIDLAITLIESSWSIEEVRSELYLMKIAEGCSSCFAMAIVSDAISKALQAIAISAEERV